MRFGLKVRVMAVEPIDAAMRFEVRFLQNTPDTRATHGPGATLKQRGDQVVQTPASGRTIARRRFTGGYRHHIEPLRGGKSAGADRGAAHPEGP